MDSIDAAGMTGIICRRIDPAREAEAEILMRQLMALCRESEGFLGSEIFPPIPGVQDAYVVLYRFSTGEALRNWLAVPKRGEILQQMKPLLASPEIEFVFTHRRRTPGTVSSVFAYRIRPGCEDQFRDWRTRILEASRTWEGFLGTESFDTFDSSNPEYIVVVRFDSREHLDAWLHSKVRAEFLQEVHQYIEDYQVRRIGSGFEGWFDYSHDVAPIAAWRQGLVVLSTLFPVIMIMRQFLSPLFSVLPFPLAFLILLIGDVAVLTYLIMPHFSRWMNFWLRPKPGRPWWSELVGWCVLLVLIGTTLGVSLRYGAR